MAEENAEKTSVETSIYPDIVSCFSQDKLDLFLKEKGDDTPVQELLDFFKNPLVVGEFTNQWKYHSNLSRFKEELLNLAFKHTVANSLITLRSQAMLRLDYEENFFPEETKDTVQKIRDYSSLLYEFVITKDFKEKADSLFPPDPLKI